MELLDAHGAALREFDRRVGAVREDQWDDPTPNTEWSVRDLVGHLVGEQLWVPLLLRGATIDEVGDRFEELCVAVLDSVHPQIGECSDWGLFAPRVPVPPDADQQTALLGLLGRHR